MTSDSKAAIETTAALILIPVSIWFMLGLGSGYYGGFSIENSPTNFLTTVFVLFVVSFAILIYSIHRRWHP